MTPLNLPAYKMPLHDSFAGPYIIHNKDEYVRWNIGTYNFKI